MSALTFAEAKELILARLREQIKAMPESEKARPRYIIDFKPYSILDLITQIEGETETGKKYVMDQAKQLGYVVQ